MLKINHFLFQNSKIQKTIKIIFISDIHYTSNFDQQLKQNMIQKISDVHPDYIFITGDIVNNGEALNDKKNRHDLLQFLKQLSNNIKTFVVLGNHDITINNMNQWKELTKNTRITILDNEIYEGDINIIGITLPSEYYKRENSDIIIDKLNKYTINDNYTVLLIHSPYKVLNNKSIRNTSNLEKIDLILSGHMHNGLVPKGFDKLPTSVGFVSPQKTLFPRYARGKITKKINNHELTMLITGGVSKITDSMPKLKVLKKLYNNDMEYICLRGQNERK